MQTTASWEIMDNGAVIITLTNDLGTREIWLTKDEAGKFAADIVADRLK